MFYLCTLIAAVIYFSIGVGFGLYMHATIQLQWRATHAPFHMH